MILIVLAYVGKGNNFNRKRKLKGLIGVAIHLSCSTLKLKLFLVHNLLIGSCELDKYGQNVTFAIH